MGAGGGASRTVRGGEDGAGRGLRAVSEGMAGVARIARVGERGGPTEGPGGHLWVLS